MALDFPASPATGQTYIDSSSYVWQFDGTGWIPYTPVSDGLCNVCLDQRNQWTAPQVGLYVPLLSVSASVTPDFLSGSYFYHELTENTTLQDPEGFFPENLDAQSGQIIFIQNAGAAKTLAFSSFWQFAGGSAPTIVTGLSSKSVLIWSLGHDSTYAICNWLSDVS